MSDNYPIVSTWTDILKQLKESKEQDFPAYFKVNPEDPYVIDTMDSDMIYAVYEDNEDGNLYIVGDYDPPTVTPDGQFMYPRIREQIVEGVDNTFTILFEELRELMDL